jgi:hypothetical protein
MSTATMTKREQALQRANEIRFARVKLKRQIAAGQLPAAQVLIAPPPEAETWPVGELLLAQHRWGTSRMRTFLNRARVPETKPVGALTQRQRRMLAAMLGYQGER